MSSTVSDLVREREYQRRYYQKYRDAVIEAKKGPCLDCGIQYPPPAMCFHHRDPSEKKFEIGGCSNYSLKALAEELLKCDLLCLNCHALRHCA